MCELWVSESERELWVSEAVRLSALGFSSKG